MVLAAVHHFLYEYLVTGMSQRFQILMRPSHCRVQARSHGYELWSWCMFGSRVSCAQDHYHSSSFPTINYFLLDIRVYLSYLR